MSGFPNFFQVIINLEFNFRLREEEKMLILFYSEFKLPLSKSHFGSWAVINMQKNEEYRTIFFGLSIILQKEICWDSIILSIRYEMICIRCTLEIRSPLCLHKILSIDWYITFIFPLYFIISHNDEINAIHQNVIFVINTASIFKV